VKKERRGPQCGAPLFFITIVHRLFT